MWLVNLCPMWFQDLISEYKWRFFFFLLLCRNRLVFFLSHIIFLILQHIDDLTQEKFSLQRALETSQALSESLAAENTTFTDSFNRQVFWLDECIYSMSKQIFSTYSFWYIIVSPILIFILQGKEVNQLKSEIERLHEKIKSQMVSLSSGGLRVCYFSLSTLFEELTQIVWTCGWTFWYIYTLF